ncbi:hypothetical protein Cpin_0450 [Chitinophaga pinensis DSM 2588]|uniref:Uncharacterized protein n=1 Tax=Chitinophaga pinensis (strain ATCC 43595 / DSM 2588 / LMG 13176 / NBRC 15968 / NCIMB 11800 / UQM 2034) TaxID=485918 RepID=A0A979GN35_CHIPD|nr:hypothetical protein Cpin_0450 [Chitinophaga pinensis DSM 2588]
MLSGLYLFRSPSPDLLHFPHTPPFNLYFVVAVLMCLAAHFSWGFSTFQGV